VHRTPAYVELHCHSAYSFLDGASLPEELADRAAELGYSALALTDHDTVAGSMEFAMSTLDSPVRAIHGTEITVTIPAGPRHLTLLVINRRGWRHLCQLLTLAHAHTRDSADRRAGQPSVLLDAVLARAEGLVCLTGCSDHGIEDEATVGRLVEAFGRERLRVELQRPYARGDRPRGRARERLARRFGLALVATGDVHAHTAERARLADAFVAVRHGLTLDASETRRRANHTHVLARPEAMAARFAHHPEAVAETVRVAEMLTFRLTGDLGYRYPGAESRDATRRLAQICEAQMRVRYPPGHRFAQAAQERLEQELRIIDGLNLSGFFLLHHEILQLAREVAIEVRGPDTVRALLPPGRGRGSSVSSIVCYLTGLSHIDPLEAELAIGRFLHEDVVGLPDIDIDFPRDIRERLIVAVHDRYGRDRAALVAAFPTYRSRGAIRELGKALGLPPGEIERVARGSEGWSSGGGVAQDVSAALGPDRVQQGRWAWLERLAREAYGLPRHLSQHPGGMVLATQPLIDCCPVVPAAMEGRQMVQWDKDSCSDAGFLKIDLLGLGMLSAVERCVELIARRRNERVDLSRIPFDDQATFAAIQEAQTTGVFQVESRAQMGSLKRTRPANLKDLAIQVALVRPGPIVGGSVNPYIERLQRMRADPSYRPRQLHPSLEGPLGETLGAIIFQDQVIDVARAFSGFTAGEAESLRRAMSRKRSQAAIDSHREKFIAGALSTHRDITEPLAEQVWSMVRGFAGFGFPKGHAAAFGLLAYQSTWLRVHHPAEFLCALLNEQPMGFYPPDSLIHEGQRRGLMILAADVLTSGAECELTAEGHIRLGLGYIKGVQQDDIERLLRARAEESGFTSLEQLAARARVGAPTLERLAWSGACDQLAGGGPYARRHALWKLGITTPSDPSAGREQLALDLDIPDVPDLLALTSWEQMVADYGATGVSIDRHPLSLLRAGLDIAGAISTAQLSTIRHGSQISLGGLVVARQRPQTANGIVFLLLEDEHGTLNVIVPERLYASGRQTIRTEPLIIVSGRLERHANGGGAVNLLAQQISRLTPVDGKPANVTTIRHDSEGDTSASENDFRAVAPPAMSFAQGRRR
jgi:error-prone DNA polymerase